VVGDALEGDVRHLLVEEAAAHAFLWVGELVKIEHARHQPLPGERERHAARVARHPTPSPLLRHHRRRPAPARDVQHEVAGVGGHQDAAFDNAVSGLNNVPLFSPKIGLSVSPHTRDPSDGKIVEVAHEGRAVAFDFNATSFRKSVEPFKRSLPVLI